VIFSTSLQKDQNSAIQEKKETISSQLAPLKMLDLNAKQQRAGQRKYATQHHKQAWNSHL